MVKMLLSGVWRSGAVHVDGMVVTNLKRDQQLCSNYRGITHLSLPGKVHARILERRLCLLLEPRIQQELCRFCSGTAL